jgi:hypothetical protein
MAPIMELREDDERLECAFLDEVLRSQRIFLAEPNMEVATRNFRKALEMFSELILNGRITVVF